MSRAVTFQFLFLELLFLAASTLLGDAASGKHNYCIWR